MSDFISDDSWCCGTRKLIEDDLRDLRAQLARVTAERDEARARIARYVAARDVLTGAELPAKFVTDVASASV